MGLNVGSFGNFIDIQFRNSNKIYLFVLQNHHNTKEINECDIFNTKKDSNWNEKYRT